MNFQATFKQMDRSLVLEEYARRKLSDKIHKFVPKLPIETYVTFSRENHLNKVHCSLRATGGFNVEVEDKDEFMYSAVDHLAEKLNTQLSRRKERNQKRGKKASKYFSDMPAAMEDDAPFNPAEVIDAGDIVKFEESRQH